MLAAYIYESSILYVDNIPFQMVSLVVVFVVCIIRFNKTKFISEIRILLPFLFTMLFVYVLLGLIGIKTGISNNSKNTVFLYWLIYGLNRTSLFISTLFTIQFLLSYISMSDVFSLPMNINKKKYLLLGRALFVHSIKFVVELEFHLKLMPIYQKERLVLKEWIRFKLQLTLAVILMLLHESKIKGELIDNRIIHCFKENN